MKKFTKKVLIYFFSVLIICFVPCIIVDPFNVFHPLNARDNGVEPNKNYIKTYYILHNPDRFDQFIMGSSHVAILNPKKISENCYNMYYSGASVDENLATLKTFLDNGIRPKNLYIGIDNISYVDSFDVHKTQRLRSPYQYSQTDTLDFFMLYLDPVVNLNAVNTILNSGNDIFKPMSTDFYSNGGAMTYGERSDMSQDETDADVIETNTKMLETIRNDNLNTDWGYLKTLLESVKEIKEICDANGIELTIFVNPIFYRQFYDATVNKAYLYFLRELSNISEYYNFSGYNKYTTDVSYYYSDAEHYSSDLGDIMLDCILYGAVDEQAYRQGFGVVVTKDNVDEVIEIISSEMLINS